MKNNHTPLLDLAMIPRDNAGLLQPMSFPGGTDGEGNPMFYPVLPPPPNGLVEPMIFEEDFKPGGRYASLTYAPGLYLGDFGVSPTGVIFPPNPSHIRFEDPTYNLPQLNHAIKQSGISEPMIPAAQYLSASLLRHGILPLFDTDSSDFEVLHLRNAKGQKVRICNCGILVESLITVINNQESQHEVRLKIIRKRPGSLPVCTSVCVPEANLVRLAEFLGNKFPWFTVASETSGAANLLNEYIREQLDVVPTQTVFRSAGWQELNGRRIFVHDGLLGSDDISFDCGQSIISDPRMDPVDAFMAALSILGIGACEVTLPLMLTALAGPLFQLFEDAGHIPRFCTFLHGLSGSLKTSTAKVFYRFFSNGQHNSFCDTPAAIDVGIAQHRDQLFLLDDFRPAVIASEGTAMRKTLEHVLRLFGDDIAKKRSNSRATATHGERPRCSCLITGESTDGSYSSLLRCLLVPITRGDILPERLREYQELPALWSSNFVYFLPWVGDNWKRLTELIRQDFQSWRLTFSHATTEPRLADTGAILMLVGKIFLEYGVFCGGIDTATAATLIAEWTTILQRLLSASTDSAQDLDVAELTREAVGASLASGSLRLAPDIASFAVGLDGFESDTRVWIYPASLLRILRQYGDSTSAVCPRTLNAVLPELCHRGIIIRDEEASKKSFLKRAPLVPALEKRPRMICFIRNELFPDP